MKDVKKKVVIKVTDDGSLKKTKKNIDSLNKSTRTASKGSMQYNRNMKGLSKQSSNASKNFSKQAQGMQGVLVPAYAEIAARVFALSAAFNALSRAANFQILIAGQAEYARMTGVNMGEIARNVQKAAKGMLDFQAASKSVALAKTAGLSASQIIGMTEAAVNSSAALGRSMDDTMDRLTRGIVKAEPEILDEIGVIMRLDVVYKAYAESVDKSTAALTESEKMAARYSAVVGQLTDKFGGIADKIDPNYFQQLSAAVMDLIMRSSSIMVKYLNPLLQFLAEAKTLLIVIMALIAKSLIGKIFPAFLGFGNKLAALPAKMDKSISRIESRMKKTYGLMTSAEKKHQASQILKPSARGPAWIKGDAVKSGTATIREANKQMKKWGEIRTGGLKDTSKADMKKINKEWSALTKKIGLGEKAVNKYARGLHSVQRGFLNVKKAGAEFMKSQVNTWRVVGRAIRMHGIFKGVRMGIQHLGKEWTKAGTAATWYGRAAARANVIGMGVTTVLRGIGAALNFILGAFMKITMFLYVGKAIVSIWHDFDTPFARAAKSAKELNVTLKDNNEKMRLTELTPFDNMAKNLSEVLKDQEFATGVADSLYTAASEAFRRLNIDMQDMGFWDSMIDMVKSAFGKGIIDEIELNISGSLKSLQGQGQGDWISQQFADSGVALTRSVATAANIDIQSAALRNAMDNPAIQKEMADAGITTANMATQFDGVQAILEAAIEDVPWEEQVAAWTKEVGGVEAATKILKDKFEENAKATSLASMATKSFGENLTKYSKDLKTLVDSLVKKTPWHNLAIDQRSTNAQWEDPNLSRLALASQLEEKGLLDRKFKDKGIVSSLGTFKEERTEASAAALIRALEGGEDSAPHDSNSASGWMNITGGIDAVKNNLLWAESAEKVAGWQKELNKLKKVGMSTLLSRPGLEKKILNEELELKQKLYDISVDQGYFDKGGKSEGLQASAKRDIELTKDKIVAADAVFVAAEKYQTTINGTVQSLAEMHTAKMADARITNSVGWQGVENSQEILKLANEYIHSLDKTLKVKQELANFDTIYHASSLKKQAEIEAAQKKRLEYTSFGGVGDASARNAIIKNSALMSIGEAHKKAQTSAGFMSTDRQFKKQVKYLDLFFKVEKLRQENIENEVALTAGMQALYDTELINAREDLIDARWAERTRDMAAAVSTIASAFGNSVTKAFKDMFEGQGWNTGTVTGGLGQGMKDAASNMIGGQAQKAVFGNKGFLGQSTGFIFGEDMQDALFPKDALELAQQQVNWLEKIAVNGIPDQYDPNRVGDSRFGGILGPIKDLIGEWGFGSAMKQTGIGLQGLFMDAFFPMANGGVASGGFRAFANGGIANRPTLGMVGEGRYNEAVVPLPDGRSIPISGGAGNVTVNVAVDANGQSAAAETTGSGARELGYRVSQAVQAELVEQQRPGGLLSSY